MLLMLCAACGDDRPTMSVTVENTLDLERTGELVEISMSEVADRLRLSDTAQVVVLNAKGEEVPTQLTYRNKLIFPVTVKACASAKYTVRPGIPTEVVVKSCGRTYPSRLDDLAWENDLVGFRAYGPALQARGERGFGYDLFTKRGTTEPVLEEMYAQEENQDNWNKVAELRKSDPKAAEEFIKSFSYHVDHGFGMDCYAVGPTLGAGVAALMTGDTIVYPWCYRTCEILDNGPLRFTARLEFAPMNVRSDLVVRETRLITLDAGSHMNRTVVTYSGLSEELPIVTGLVLHDSEGAVTADAERGFIAYTDPTTGPDQGKIFVGAAFPAQVKEAKRVLFSDEERPTRNNALGHVLAVSDYKPGSAYTYYWGFGWSRADISDAAAWDKYLTDFTRKIRTPLLVKTGR